MSHFEKSDLFAEIHELVTERIGGRMTEPRFRRLEQLLKSEPAARRIYVEYLHETVALQTMLGPVRDKVSTEWHVPELAKGAAGDLPRPSPEAQGRATRTRGYFGRLLHVGNAAMLMLAVLFSGVLAATLVIGIALYRAKMRSGAPEVVTNQGVKPVDAAPVARVARTADCRWSRTSGHDASSSRLEPGDVLKPGRSIMLESGLVEIVFENGADALVQGPAELRIDSAASAFLKRGKLTVAAETSLAHGFTVITPGMKYTDLGTEFGVSVAGDGAEEMDVFRGSVSAQVLGEGMGEVVGDGVGQGAGPVPLAGGTGGRRAIGSGSGRASQAPTNTPPLTLTAHQAVRIAGPRQPVERFAADEKQFVHAMPAIEPIPVFSTGVGLDRGAADPHWNIIEVSSDRSFKPSPAVVANPGKDYLPDARDTAQWISFKKEFPDMPGGCRMTFRTRFDLTGFDPATARIEGECATDDWPVELRVNGHTSVPLPPEARTLKLPVVPLHIDKGFVAGENVIEIVVENAEVPQMPMNAMALYVHWKGTARKVAKSN